MKVETGLLPMLLLLGLGHHEEPEVTVGTSHQSMQQRRRWGFGGVWGSRGMYRGCGQP